MTEPFYFSPHIETLHLGGDAQKAENNLRVIRLIKQLDEEGRSATPDERTLLATYTGWGDSSVLHHKLSEVVDSVTEEEWDSIQGSTLNAHYTTLSIIRAMWSGVTRLGAGKLPLLRVLDPSAGVGHFFSAMPESLRGNSRWVEIELDKVTAKILQYLHPDTEGRNATFNDGFQNVPLIPEQFDLVISNIPFGNYPVIDRTMKDSRLKACIHDYFFAKAVALTRPGGVIAFITSRYTLDKKNRTVREWLAGHTDLLGAVRLPDTAFLSNAGTEVVTDILFLQKRYEVRQGNLPSWVETQEVELDHNGYLKNDEDKDGKVRHNLIYCEHPEWMVGHVATKRGMYSAGEYTVKYDGDRPIGDVVAEILENILPEDGLLAGYRASQVKDVVVETTPPPHVIPIPDNTPLDHRRRLEGLREIYDTARKLLDMEASGGNLLAIAKQREALNDTYDSFVARFGPITNKLNQKIVADSAAHPFLLALELDYQALTNTAHKARIFYDSTVRSAGLPEEIKDCQDAFLFCLNKTGGVDIDWIASLAKVSVEQAESELTGRILWTPEGYWEIAEKYLSGNIVEKLHAARAMAAIEPRLKTTIDALTLALPKPLKPNEIKARLGSGWIPTEYIEDFVREILPGVSPQVTYIPKLGAWKLSVRNKWAIPAENTTRWGTERKGALELLEMGLDAQTPVVYDEIDDKRVINKEATIAAQAKLEELKAHFVTWLWKDSDRAEHLAQIYNERFNVFARPNYNGSHLTFPGLSLDITPRQLQKDAIWFNLQNRSALVGDEVGLGKTLTAIISAMEAIRLGFVKKAMFVVPNHLTEDPWHIKFMEAYPNAKVLCAGKDDLSKRNRQLFMSRIATGDWDIVIVPESSFKLLPVSPKTMNEFIEAELDELRDFLLQLKSSDDYDRRALKEIQKAIKRFEARLVDKSDMAKDSTDTITWEQLGIDLLIVDEFHHFKNLYMHTKMTRIAGLPNSDSQRAFDMFIKVRNLQQRGKRFIGLTGTPLTNTIAEIFTMQRYFQYDTLVDLGLSHFDSWAQMFADAVMIPEMTPDGGGFRVNTRLARFTNIPELASMFSQFMIMRRWEQVSDEVERPLLYNNKPTPVKMPGSKLLREFVKVLAERAEKVRSGKIDPKDDNMLKITGEGRKAALDMRLLFPEAADLGTSKINTSAWVISEIYRFTEPHKAAQLVFCDLGTPKPQKDKVVIKDDDDDQEENRYDDDEPSFKNVYADLKAKLVNNGVRADEIAFIHDAKNPPARAQLFESVRKGRIRVLIGSTEKMGTGMNVQTRAIADHHLDAPWRPADLEQRGGRKLRQGNIYREVFSFVYITEGSFDSYVWQILETKARFIAQFLTGNTQVREMDDIGDTVLSMAEIKALASGNPRIIERVVLQNEVVKLENLRASWQSNRRDSQRRLSQNREELGQTQTRVGYLRKAAEIRDANPAENFSMKINGVYHEERRTAGAALIEAARILKLEAERTGQEARKNVGVYKGFTMWLRVKPNSERSMRSLVEESGSGAEILLDYGVPQVLVAHVSDSDTGTVMSIDATIRSIDGEITKNDERIEYLTRQVEKFNAALGEEWEHASKLETLAAKLALLDKELIDAGVKLTDSTAPVSDEEDADAVEEIVTAPTMESEPEPEAVVDFALDEILDRITQLVASTTAPEEAAIALPSFDAESSAIPVTPALVADLKEKAQTAQALAELGENLIVGLQRQMTLEDLWNAHKIDQAVKKKSGSRKSAPVDAGTVQLTLF